MRNYCVNGLVLKRFNYGEADRLLWILAKDKGLFQAKAKGIRKIKAKLKGPLELFMLSNIELAKGKSLDTITGAQIINSYNNIRSELELTSTAFYFSELLINFLIENEDANSYNLAVRSFSNLDNKTEDRFLILKFLVRLLEITGFSPQLDNCLKCSQQINKSDGQIFFDFSSGGLVCSNCLSKLEVEENQTRDKIEPKTIKLIRLIKQGKTNINIDDHNISRAELILERFAESIMEKQINSNRFLNQARDA